MNSSVRLREAIQSKSLTALTKAITELADELAYQLKTQYTEIMQLKAREESDRFAIHFIANYTMPVLRGNKGLCSQHYTHTLTEDSEV